VVLKRVMSVFLTKVLLLVPRRLRSQARLRAENLVLRRQVLILSRNRTCASYAAKPRLADLGVAVPVLPFHSKCVPVVKPETVLR
jgi:hypothetical protein